MVFQLQISAGVQNPFKPIFAHMPAFLLFLFLLFFGCGAPAKAQTLAGGSETRWTDSVYKALSPQERIGQLFMAAAYSGGKNYNEEAILKLLKSNQIGGLIFMQGGPVRQALLTNKYQGLSKVPLLIGMDAEWGLGMRLDSVEKYPRQMMLGATRDTALMYRIGAAIGQQCRRLGVHVNFAPDVDVNNNPDNPVINSRSFGEDKYQVARMGIAYAKGMQDLGVMACAKHFPGHGNTSVDSHKDLPVVNSTRAQLDETELYPFRELIKAGVQSIMIAHLEVPALEPKPKMPTTLSPATVTKLLREELGFNGLIFTDALNMQGVAKYYAPGEVDLKAFLAGNDVLLFSQEVPTAISKIEAAVADGRIKPADLEARIKKILRAKWRAGLSSFVPIRTAGLTADLNQYTESLLQATAQKAVTLVGSGNSALTTLRQRGSRIGYIGINAGGSTPLYQALKDSLGARLEARYLPKGSTVAAARALAQSLDRYDAVVVGVHGIGMYPAGNYGLDAGARAFLSAVEKQDDAVLVVLGNAYALQNFCAVGSALVTYEETDAGQVAAAGVLLGRALPAGRLPVTPCPGMKVGRVLQEAAPAPISMPQSPAPATLQPANYDEAGVTVPTALSTLSKGIGAAVGRGAFPGCRVLAVRNSRVFYDLSVGKLTYTGTETVKPNTLYDVASLTKVLSTTLAVMKLYEEGRIALDAPVSKYLPATAGTDKAGITIRDLLLHRAGLVPYIPFWKSTMEASGAKSADWYRPSKQAGYNLPVTQNLWARNDIRDTIWQAIYSSPRRTVGKYVYSDNDFYFLWAVVEKVTGKPMPQYLAQQFYGPLGLKYTGFNPLEHFPKEQIAPTENDALWRGQQVWGTVHDQGAALLGGVAGHAGLFSTAEEVAVIFQMLLNGGTYAGKRFLAPKTVTLFTGYQNSSRRGLGFDKPEPGLDAVVTADACSKRTFGHTGFTGTCAWADPATGIVFVFLSNRVFPNAENGLITKLSVRTDAQQHVYESFGLNRAQ